MNPQQVYKYLPDAPDGYSYTTTQHNTTTVAVWLTHHFPYDYACGKSVKTIWGFIKKGMVYPAMSSKTPHKTPHTPLSKAHTLSPYTATIPTVSSLLHL